MADHSQSPVFSGCFFILASSDCRPGRCLWIFASTTGQSLGLTVLQEIAPGDARGLSVSLASLVNIGIGLALGAYLPALILDHVLHDPARVAAAVTIVALPCALVSTWLYRASLKALVRSEAA